MAFLAHPFRPPMQAPPWSSPGPSTRHCPRPHLILTRHSTNTVTRTLLSRLWQACVIRRTPPGSVRVRLLLLVHPPVQLPRPHRRLPRLVRQLRLQELILMTMSWLVLVLEAFPSPPSLLRVARRFFCSRRDRHLPVAGAETSNQPGCRARILHDSTSRVSATRSGLTQTASHAKTPRRWQAAFLVEVPQSTLAFGGSPIQQTSIRTSPQAGGRAR